MAIKSSLISILRKSQRIIWACLNTVAMIVRHPSIDRISVSSLSSSEENGLMFLIEADTTDKEVFYMSPHPEQSKELYRSLCLLHVVQDHNQVSFEVNSRFNLMKRHSSSHLNAYTHALFEGKDLRENREHHQLTHGSGIKREVLPETPITHFYSITDEFIHNQLEEYHCSADVRVLSRQPRLSTLALDPDSIGKHNSLLYGSQYVVFAPTYRGIKKNGTHVRHCGTAFSEDSLSIECIRAMKIICESLGISFWIKLHPVEAIDFTDKYPEFREVLLTVHPSQSTYAMFSQALLTVTDYSSLLYDLEAHGKKVLLWCPDFTMFKQSYRGFRSLNTMHYQDTADLKPDLIRFKEKFMSALV